MDPNSQNPYEFILNPEKPVKRNPLAGGSFVMKITLIVGLGVFVIIILWVIVTLSSGGGKENTAQLVAITQAQQEIKRVASQGSTLARGQKVRNFGTTTNLTLTSNQLQLLTFLQKRGTSVKGKELTLKRNPVTDQTLAKARDASEFDEAFTAEMQKEVQAYQAAVKSAYNGTKSTSERKLLSGFYSQANLLLEQSKETL